VQAADGGAQLLARFGRMRAKQRFQVSAGPALRVQFVGDQLAGGVERISFRTALSNQFSQQGDIVQNFLIQQIKPPLNQQIAARMLSQLLFYTLRSGWQVIF